MSDKPFVTIVIPVFNGEKYIREAIESALGQTYENIEVIVVDDGSVDHTSVICNSYGTDIRYVYKMNGGVASAVNLGIKMMGGEYFSWLSHDDVYYPNKIEKQIEYVLNCGDRTKIVHGNYDLYNEDSGSLTHIRNDETYTTERMENSVFPLLVTAFQGCVPLVHKSHFERVGIFDECQRLTQDYDFFFRAMRGEKTLFINEPLVRVRMHREAGRVISADFGKECSRQYLTFMDMLSVDEIKTMFTDESIFYYRTAGMVAARGFEKMAYQIVRDIPIQDEVREENIFAIRITEMLGKEFEHILIYGAGFQGRLLAYELRGRGCHIEAFADQNELLCGKRIDGALCIKLDDLKKYRKRSLIIVSPDDSEEIVSQMKKRGFESVITKKDLEKILLETKPYSYRQICQETEDFFKKRLENALAHYDRVVFLYQPSKELCVELETRLKKEKRAFLILTDIETLDFPCSQEKLNRDECRWLLELYFSYSFSDRFIFLTDQRQFPWPSIMNFAETGLAAKEEIWEALLK